MGECTDFFAARRSDLRKGGEAAQNAFWEHQLGFLNKAHWFDVLRWNAAGNLEASAEDRELIQNGIHTDNECPLTVKFLEDVISTLEELDRDVLAMPCDPENDDARYEIKTIKVPGDKKWGMQFLGTPNGIAMMERVADFLGLRCDIDFIYPWNKNLIKHYGMGTKYVRNVLRDIINKYDALNTDGDWILYKTTG